ncbi:hypothetical protein J6590_056133 [Homalodisca vitripennis]|nr:hypothetical protein J6590_056133 [Homalodisca vitripennis]
MDNLPRLEEEHLQSQKMRKSLYKAGRFDEQHSRLITAMCKCHVHSPASYDQMTSTSPRKQSLHLVHCLRTSRPGHVRSHLLPCVPPPARCRAHAVP